jgi:hypothetical protein
MMVPECWDQNNNAAEVKQVIKAQKPVVWRRKSQIVDKRLNFFHTKLDSVAIRRRDKVDPMGERQGSAVFKAIWQYLLV